MIVVATTTVVETPVEATAPPVTRLGITLVGSDGSTWDLINGPVHLQSGPTGLLPDNVLQRWSEPPILDGAIFRGYRVPAQNVTLPVFVSGGTGLGFRDLDAALWRALDPSGEVALVVTTPDAETRTLSMRFVGPGDAVQMDRDPILMGRATYSLSFVAADPYWYGAPVTQSFRNEAAPPPFFATSGVVLNIASDQTSANSSVRNDGDVEAWAVYSAAGAVAGFSVGVGDSTLEYGNPVADGATVWVDTYPTRQTVGFSRGDNDETAWLGLTARNFAPIPPGAEVPIDVVLTSAGANALLTVELTPRYRRPW